MCSLSCVCVCFIWARTLLPNSYSFIVQSSSVSQQRTRASIYLHSSVGPFIPRLLPLPLPADCRAQANWHIRCFITFRLVFGQLTTFLRLLCVSVSVWVCKYVCVCGNMCISVELKPFSIQNPIHSYAFASAHCSTHVCVCVCLCLSCLAARVLRFIRLLLSQNKKI